MKTALIALLLSLAATSCSRVQAAPAIPVEPPSPMVRLFTGGQQIVFSEIAQTRLRQQITSLLKSSNFHSGPDDQHGIFTRAGVQQDYRDTVASGEYLLMTLSCAQKIATVGGEVTVAEIVVGLRGPGGKNTVFTTDETGMLMAHAKYSGEVYLVLKKVVGEEVLIFRRS